MNFGCGSETRVASGLEMMAGVCVGASVRTRRRKFGLGALGS